MNFWKKIPLGNYVSMYQVYGLQLLFYRKEAANFGESCEIGWNLWKIKVERNKALVAIVGFWGCEAEAEAARPYTFYGLINDSRGV